MIIKINIKLLSLAVFIVLAAAVVVYFLFSYTSTGGVQQQLPSDVAYALEYFNAVNSNKTIIVPSIYYQLAQGYMINNNQVISNDSEYAQILFDGKRYNNTDFVLIDMNQLNFLKSLYSGVGLPLHYNVTVFPSSYVFGNVSRDERNCDAYSNSTELFAECQLYVSYSVTNPNNSSQIIANKTTDVGYIAVAYFPNNPTLYAINASVFYNGTDMVYVPSDVNSTSKDFLAGIAFVYENVTTLYLPPEIMGTFYGSHMFLPNSTTNKILDSFGEARVVAMP